MEAAAAEASSFFPDNLIDLDAEGPADGPADCFLEECAAESAPDPLLDSPLDDSPLDDSPLDDSPLDAGNLEMFNDEFFAPFILVFFDNQDLPVDFPFIGS